MLVAQISAAELLTHIATEQDRRRAIFLMWESQAIAVEDAERVAKHRQFEQTERFELELDRARDLMDTTKDTAPSWGDLTQASEILWGLMNFLDDELRPDTTPDEDISIRIMRRLVHSAMIPLQHLHQEQSHWEESQQSLAVDFKLPESGDYWDEAEQRWRPIDVQEELYFMGSPDGDDDCCPNDFDSACLMRLATYTDGLVSAELAVRISTN